MHHPIDIAKNNYIGKGTVYNFQEEEYIGSQSLLYFMQVMLDFHKIGQTNESLRNILAKV